MTNVAGSSVQVKIRVVGRGFDIPRHPYDTNVAAYTCGVASYCEPNELTAIYGLHHGLVLSGLSLWAEPEGELRGNILDTTFTVGVTKPGYDGRSGYGPGLEEESLGGQIKGIPFLLPVESKPGSPMNVPASAQRLGALNTGVHVPLAFSNIARNVVRLKQDRQAGSSDPEDYETVHLPAGHRGIAIAPSETLDMILRIKAIVHLGHAA